MLKRIDLREFADSEAELEKRRTRNAVGQQHTTTKNPAIHRPRRVSWKSRERAIKARDENREVTRREGVDPEHEQW